MSAGVPRAADALYNERRSGVCRALRCTSFARLSKAAARRSVAFALHYSPTIHTMRNNEEVYAERFLLLHLLVLINATYRLRKNSMDSFRKYVVGFVAEVTADSLIWLDLGYVSSEDAYVFRYQLMSAKQRVMLVHSEFPTHAMNTWSRTKYVKFTFW